MPITKHNMLVTDARGDPAGDRRGVPPRVHRPTRPGAGGHPQGRPAGADDLQLAAGAAAARLPADDPAARQADPRGRQADHRRAPARCSTSAAACSRPRRPRSCCALAELTGIPVVTTLMARGAFPDSHPQHVGMPGMHGTVAAVGAMQRSDLLVALGARFDDRVTGQLASFAPDAKIVHADIDPAEISKNRRGRRADRGRLPRGHPGADRRGRGGAGGAPRGRPAPRGGRSSTTCARPTRSATTGPPTARSPRSTSSSGSARSPARTRSTRPGVGQHQMWAAQFIRYEKPRTWLNSGGLGTMGYAVPAAMGAKMAVPGRRRLVHRRRRLLPDDQPGARHLRDRGHPDQGGGHQQRQPRHGPPVAEPVLRRALLADRPRHPQAPHPGLQAAGRGDGLRGAARGVEGGRRPRHPRGHGDQRPAGRDRLRGRRGRAGVADGRRRHRQRPDHGRARHPAAVRQRRARGGPGGDRRRHRGGPER